MIFLPKNLVNLRNSLRSIQVNLAELNSVLVLEKARIEKGDLTGFQAVVLRKEEVTNGLIGDVNTFIELSRNVCTKLHHEYCKLPASSESNQFTAYFGLETDRLVSISQIVDFFIMSKKILLANRAVIAVDALKLEMAKIETTIKELEETFSKIKGYEKRVKENREIVRTFLEFQNKSIRFWQGIQQEVEASYGQDGKAAHARAKPIFSASA